MSQARRVAVLGAGITGLSAAWEVLQRGGAEVTVFEASPRVGGKILTEESDGFLFEAGPDSFVTMRPQAAALARELGLGPDLLDFEMASGGVGVFWGGRLRFLPAGMSLGVPTRVWPLVSCDLLSWRGKLRAALEPWVPGAEGEQDESLACFLRRRLGSEVLERAAGPMLAGIYAADPEKLSLLATFPQLREMERRGGLVRGMLARNGRGSSSSGGMKFSTLRRGLGSLASALAGRLGPRVRTGAAVQSLRSRWGVWHVRAAGQTLEADAVISALPAWAMADLVEAWDFELAGALREIPFASSATVSFAFDEGSLGGRLRGTGFLVPVPSGKGGRPPFGDVGPLPNAVSAASYSSIKFPGRAPAGKVLIRCFVGGAGRESALSGGASGIEGSALEDVRRILGLPSLAPAAARTHLWPRANPQYAPGHGLLLRRVESCLRGHPGLVLAGCSYRGIGLPDCVRSGREAGRMAAASAAAGPRAAPGRCA